MGYLLVRIFMTLVKLFMRLLGIAEKFRNTYHELLHTFIVSNCNSSAKAMLNPNFKMCDDYGSLLHFAVDYGNSTIVRHLLELGANVDSLGPRNRTPLMVAIENDRERCVKDLLQAKANLYAVDATGDSVLRILYHTEVINPKIIEAIHDRMKIVTPSVDELIDKLICAGGSLYHAVYFKDTKILEHAVTRFDLNFQGQRRMTALHAAAHLQNLDLAKWLINRGADVNVLDEDNVGPLFHSVLVGDRDMVRFLLERGADPNVEEVTEGSSPLYVAVEYFRGPDIVELLVEYGAVPRNATGRRRTIFDQALRDESYEIVGVLVGCLAVLGKLGTCDVKSVMFCNKLKNREAMSQFVKYYELCEKMIEISVFGSLKLFDLLVEGDVKIKLLVRNETFVGKINEFCTEHKLKELYTYYFNSLMKRVAKAERVVELENKVIPVICDLFDVNYNQCYFVARKIVEYLDEPDLVRLSGI